MKLARLLTMAMAVGSVYAGSAYACLNDNESPTHEREFRSSYERGNYAVQPLRAPSREVSPGLLAGAGVCMAGGALFLLVRHGRGSGPSA